MSEQSITLEAFQFAANNGPFPLQPLGPEDSPLLAEIQKILADNGMEDRFGLSLINKNLPLAPSEVTMETTDHEKRRSSLRVMNQSELDLKYSLPTNWHFEIQARPNPGRCKGWCDYRDETHKVVHGGKVALGLN